MFKRLIDITCLMLTIVLNGCAIWQATTMPKQLQDRQIIVTLSEDKRSSWLAIDSDLKQRYALQAVGEFPLTSIQVNCLVYRVPDNQSVSDVIAHLKTDQRIQLVQQNQVFAGLRSQAGDAYAALSYAPKMLGVDDAHQVSTGKGVSVTVIDTGADKNHPDLKGQVEVTRNFVEGGEVSFSQDKHGTAVLGVISARADDGIGIYGVAPDASIAIYKACWYEDANSRALCSSWTLAKALDAAINAGSRVINLSLNGPADELLKQLITTAYQRNSVIVAAANEHSDQPGFPASMDKVIPVLAAGPDGHVTKPVWPIALKLFAAPGIEILTTAPRDGYDFVSGSSLATAHVSGVLALMLQFKPELTPEQLRSALMTTNATGKTELASVNACAALKGLGAAVDCH